jgi:hypothetical protein
MIALRIKVGVGSRIKVTIELISEAIIGARIEVISRDNRNRNGKRGE